MLERLRVPDVTDDRDARAASSDDALTVDVVLDVADGVEADRLETEVEAEAPAEERQTIQERSTSS